MGLFNGFLRRREKKPPEAAPPVPDAAPEEAPVQEKALPPVLRAANFQGAGGRERQEDSFAVINATDMEEADRRGVFAIMADGMGGMLDGKQASEWAVQSFVRLFREMEEGEDVPSWFCRSVCAVSDSVFRQFGGLSGTTVTAVHWKDGLLYWLSVGDSAIYLCRGGGVFQLNKEHTYLNQLFLEELSRDVIDKERAWGHEDARRLTSFVGIDRLTEMDLNLRPLRIRPGDAVLLCSDGVSGVLTPPELVEAMTMDPHEGCALLERMVLEKGVPEQDNYTGVLLSYR